MKKPDYAVKKIDFKGMHTTENALAGLNLHTVCHQARCPNISECYARGTAAFLILGDTCTRNCTFCNVKKGKPNTPDINEAKNLATAVHHLKLNYVVITSVTRDDLDDGGAGAFVSAMNEIRILNQGIKIEVLVPDFGGSEKAVETVAAASPDVFAHNVETVPSLYRIRKGADYKRSLEVLRHVKKQNKNQATKSSLLLGLGEKEEEVLTVLSDLISVGCDFVSMGQYLRPDLEHEPVVEFIRPEKFEDLKQKALVAGFKHVESGVWVRSSYMAETYFTK